MKNDKTKPDFYYPFLTVFLLISTIYLSTAGFYNVVKFINYKTKLVKLETEYKKANDTKTLLNAEIEGFKSPEAYENFLRNNLKRVGQNEIRVIIVPKEK